MAVRVGINGFGRIGRNFFRAQKALGADVEIVAVNDLGDAATMAHLLKYDSTLGPFPGEVSLGDGVINAGGEQMKMLSERDPAALPWGELGVDTVLECTGLFASKAKAGAHLKGGAKRVVISAPGGDDVDDLKVVVRENDGAALARAVDHCHLHHRRLVALVRFGERLLCFGDERSDPLLALGGAPRHTGPRLEGGSGGP